MSTQLMIAAAMSLATAAPASAAALSFYNGTISNVGADLACVSNLSEVLEQSYAGFSIRNGFYYPAPGEVWYAHVVVSHPGNPCSGGSATGISVQPPSNTTFAIDVDNPVYCAIRNLAQQVKVYNRQDQACPQFPTSTGDGYYIFPFYNGNTPQPWLIATGTYVELMIPLRSSTGLVGSAMTFRINPDLGVYGYPAVGVQVFGDVIFRADLEFDLITPDICGISGTTLCALQP